MSMHELGGPVVDDLPVEDGGDEVVSSDIAELSEHGRRRLRGYSVWPANHELPDYRMKIAACLF